MGFPSHVPLPAGRIAFYPMRLLLPALLATAALRAHAEENAVRSITWQPNQVTITLADGQLELRPVNYR